MNEQYAGFWLRFFAYCIDWVILSVAFSMLNLIVGIPFATMQNLTDTPFPMPFAISYITITMIFNWLYYSLLESSPWQATIGKRAIKIKVTDLNGNRISFARATGRFFSKILSTAILFIGYFMIGFTKRKQGLHDIIAETLVVRS